MVVTPKEIARFYEAGKISIRRCDIIGVAFLNEIIFMVIGLVLGYKGRKFIAKLFGFEKKKEK